MKNLLIYQVFVRNFSQKGTINEVTKKLPYIKSLGMDFVYLLPIHPIGEVARKGTVGSPYSIQNYLQIDENLGTLDDFKNLINEAHKQDLKVMMDIVFHHTSRDADYIKEHPEWYVYKKGKLANKVGDWSDIADLNLDNLELQNFLIEVLINYTKLGVDGFRFDVASLIYADFFKKAKTELKKINPNVIFLAECIDPLFSKYVHSINEYVASDDELFENGFDYLYAYDVHPDFMHYLQGKGTLKAYVDALKEQQKHLSNHASRMNFLENHDQPRITSLVKDKTKLTNFIYFYMFLPGASLVYAGQEYGMSHRPDLFEKDPITMQPKEEEVFKIYQGAINLRLRCFKSFSNDYKVRLVGKRVVKVTIEQSGATFVGLFNLGTKEDVIPFKEKEVKNIINNEIIKAENNTLRITDPVIYIE
jgi:glycosidase